MDFERGYHACLCALLQLRTWYVFFAGSGDARQKSHFEERRGFGYTLIRRGASASGWLLKGGGLAFPARSVY